MNQNLTQKQLLANEMEPTKENLSLIDTDILIFLLKNNSSVIQKSKKYQQKFGKLKISELTYYECLRGYKYSNATKKLELFLQLIDAIEIIPLSKSIYNSQSKKPKSRSMGRK